MSVAGHIAAIKDRLRESYNNGTFAADVIYGTVLDEGMRTAVNNLLSFVSAQDQGDAAELRRLKEYLGSSLPADWELLRTRSLT